MRRNIDGHILELFWRLLLLTLKRTAGFYGEALSVPMEFRTISEVLEYLSLLRISIVHYQTLLFLPPVQPNLPRDTNSLWVHISSASAGAFDCE